MSPTSMRQTIGILAAITVAGCARSGSDAGREKTLRLGGAEVATMDVSGDGRLAFHKFVGGKWGVFVSKCDGSSAKQVSFGVYDYAPLWSPDGKWILFGRDQGGQGDVFIVPSDSGAERAVAATSVHEIPNAWLADGSGVLFTKSTDRGAETWVFRIADGSSEKLLNVDGSTDGYPSPDGKWLAYTLTKGGKTTVWLWDMATKSARQLTTEGFERVMFGAFSPDSRSVIFESRRTGTSDLWRANVASGALTQITQDIAPDYDGRWSPDGTRVVFRSTRGGQPDVWVLSQGESDVERVTNDALYEESPKWMPDGQRIVFATLLGHSHLYSLPISGGPAAALTSGDWDVVPSQGSNQLADVSRDAMQVVYSGTRNGDQDIWTVPTAGGEPRLISGAPGFDGDPVWSADASQVAFTSARGGNQDIWIVPAAGGTARRLTDWTTAESNPQWSPDGNFIAFLSTRDSPGTDIWTLSAGGGAAKRVTTLGNVIVGNQFSWSPDGRELLFAARGANGVEVYAVAATGGAPRILVPATSFRPRWSPDGHSISVAKCEGGYCLTELWSAAGVRVRSLAVETEIYENNSRWSADGSQVFVQAQNLRIDGGYRIDIRPSAGGAGRTLIGPTNANQYLVGFGPGEKSVIALVSPNGNQLKWVTVPKRSSPK